jgi:hypothetical protein
MTRQGLPFRLTRLTESPLLSTGRQLQFAEITHIFWPHCAKNSTSPHQKTAVRQADSVAAAPYLSTEKQSSVANSR